MRMTDMPNEAPRSIRVTPGRWISAGWALVREDLSTFLLMTLIALALTVAAGFTLVGPILVGGPLLAGMFGAVRRRMLEGHLDFMDLFQGFNTFLDTFLLGLVVSVFSLAGLALCIIPFFLVGALYLFPFLFLIERRIGFWDAMESSRKIAGRELAGYVAFFLTLCLLNLAGLILAGVGVLITIPVSLAAIAVAYDEAVGFDRQKYESEGPIVIP